jgi:hypothetical protein
MDHQRGHPARRGDSDRKRRARVKGYHHGAVCPNCELHKLINEAPGPAVDVRLICEGCRYLPAADETLTPKESA